MEEKRERERTLTFLLLFAFLSPMYLFRDIPLLYKSIFSSPPMYFRYFIQKTVIHMSHNKYKIIAVYVHALFTHVSFDLTSLYFILKMCRLL